MALTRITKGVIKPNENYDTHNINSTGIITATSFSGPFTGVGNSSIQSGILTATGIDLNGDLDVDGHTNLDNVSIAGVTTAAGAIDLNADLDVDGHTNLDNVSIAGVTTFAGAISGTTASFSGNVSIGGTLTYEDVTNIDSVGIITARDGLKVLAGGANVVGVSTFKDDVEIDVNSKKLKLGTSGQLNLTFNGNNSVIQGTAGHTLFAADSLKLTNANSSHNYFEATNGGAATLYHANNPKLATSSSGATVTGALISSFGGVNTRLGFVSGGAEGIVETTSNHSLALGVNSSEKLRITSSGALLVGTETPTYNSGDMQHEIKKNNSRTYTAPLMTGHSHLLLNNSDTTTNAFCGLGFRAGSGDGSIGYVYTGSANAADFVINTDGGANGVERLRITSTGQVLIGINNAVDAEVDLQIHSATSGNGPILNMTNNTGDCRIFFGQDSSSSSANAQGQIRYNVANNYLSAHTAGDERFRITSAGNIGINTSIPSTSHLLSFDGASNYKAGIFYKQAGVNQYRFMCEGGTGHVYYDTFMDGGDHVFRTNAASTGGTEALRISEEGKVGIGLRTSSPNELLHVHTSSGQANIHVEGATDGQIILRAHSGDSVIHLGDASATSVGKILYEHSSDSLQFTANSSPRFVIHGTGYAEFAGASNVRLTLGSQGTAGTNDSNWIRGSGEYLMYNNAGTGGAHIWEVGGNERLRLEAGGRVNFLTGNNDFTNPDIGGSTAGVTINKNTTGQIYACTDAGGSGQANDTTSVTLNLSRRNTAGDGPQLALDRGGWIKASLAGLVGSNTANGQAGQFAVYTHNYATGANVRTEQLRIMNNGQWYIGRDGVGGRMYTDGSSGSLYLQSGNGRQTFRIYDMASGQSHTTHLDATGQLGIGIAPADKLHIYHASNDPFIKIQRDTNSSVSIGGIKFASGAGSGIFATMGARVTSNSGEKGAVYIQTQDGSGVTREPWRAVGASGGHGERLTSQGNSVCVFGSDQTHGNQFTDGRPDSNNVYEHSQSAYRNNSNGMYGGTFVVTGTGGSAATTWYPVWFSLHGKFPQMLTLGRYVHNYGSWDGTFLFRAEISGTGYGGYAAMHRVQHHSTSSKNFIGRIKFTTHNNAYLVLWMLGGGRSYHWGTIGGGMVSVNVGDDGNNHNLGPGNTAEGPITSSDTMDYGYEPNMNDSPSHQQTGFT